MFNSEGDCHGVARILGVAREGGMLYQLLGYYGWREKRICDRLLPREDLYKHLLA